MGRKADAELIRQAERILEGWLDLPGRPGLTFVGPGLPDWKRLPEDNGDMEAVFVLNRHEHWNVLMDAYGQIGDERYGERVWREFEDWYQACPCPEIRMDETYLREWFDPYTKPERACWRSLEAGIRMFRVWRRIPKFLFQAKCARAEYLEHFFRSLIQHGQVLSKVSPVLFPKADHNHYLMENFGLLALGCAYPELEEAGRWREQAVEELKRCFLAQIAEDGGQIEGCPHYHNESVILMAQAVETMNAYGIVLEDRYRERLKKALDYTRHSVRPTGKNVAFGDSDAGVSWKTALELGRATFCGGEAGTQAAPPSPLYYEKTLGQVFVRSDWGTEAASLAVICKTPVQNEHSHMDACSFEFTAFGKTMLTDPGRYTYREGEDRKRFKSAEFHNTLLVNGTPPFAYIGTWKYGSQRPAYITEVNGRWIQMRQEAYWPAVHERRICYDLSGARPVLLIRDEIANLKKGEFVDLYYHLDFTEVRETERGVLAWDEETGAACRLSVYPRQKGEVLEGMVSEEMDHWRVSKRYHCRVSSQGGCLRLYTAIVATKENHCPFPGSALQ